MRIIALLLIAGCSTTIYTRPVEETKTWCYKAENADCSLCIRFFDPDGGPKFFIVCGREQDQYRGRYLKGYISMSCFRDELERVINSYSKENGSNTPDFILADYMAECLEAFDRAVNRREKWYGRQDDPGFCGEDPKEP